MIHGRHSLGLACAFALFALLGSCTSGPTEPTARTAASASSAAPARPRLIVFLVVDGLPMRQVTGYRDQLAPDGLARFLDRGTWFADAHYGHAFTVTAAGHATMLSGAYPHRSGIIGNDWRDPATGEVTYCTGDPSATYIGNETKKLDGTSPKNLRVETVGDVLRRVDPRSKVIGISGKDRGAILPAGKTGIAYMYMAQSGDFASTRSICRSTRRGSTLQCREARRPLLQGRMDADARRVRVCRVAARQPAVVSPAREAADDDGRRRREARTGVLQQSCFPAPSSTSCRLPSRARRSSASSSARTTFPTS